MLRRDHIIPVTQSGCRAALMALGLVLVLQPPRLPQVSAQRPLNANVSGPMMLGPGTGGYGALATVRGYSLFNNGGAGHAGGAAAGNPSIGDHQSMGGGGTNRKLSSRPSYTNALDTAKRPQSGSIEADGGGHQLGGPGVGGAEGGGPYQPSNGRTASYRRPFASADLIVADGVLKASSNADGGGDASPGDTLLYPPVATGPGRKYTLYDVRQRQRPNDEATAVYAVEKNPMHVLKEIFRNDQSIRRQPPHISHQMETVLGVKCNFETPCAWTWDEAVTDGFQTLSGANLTKSNRTGLFPGPVADSRNDANGHFLYLRLTANTSQRILRSPIFGVSRENCYLQLVVHQSGMRLNSMRLVIEPQNGDDPWVLAEIAGNDGNTWDTMRQRIGRVTKDFRILFEVVPIGYEADDERGHIAIDELVLRDCFPEVADNDTCRMAQVRCQKNRQEMCLRTVKVCDLDVDCDGQEDERLNCDKIPSGGRCDFEDGWCGWRNSGRVTLLWERHSGPTPTEKTGPDADHTMQAARNGSQGHYMYVNMNQHGHDAERKHTVGFASNAVMNSVVFNPPPAVNYNASSPYAHRCMVRFYVHQYGPNAGSVNLSVVEIGERENVTTTLWWSSKDLGPDWRREDLILTNITGRYFLQFEARMGMRIFSDVAIDDFSLAPECFGLNIPVDELNGYNYYDPKLFDNRPAHRDFVNRSVVSLSTCGARGKDGPRIDQCNAAYNQTEMQKSVRLLTDAPHRGVQVWKVPGENYYTIIAKGAGGGLGSAGVGSSRGARAVSVLELHRDEEIHILVGQKGEHACIKSMGYREKECEAAAAEHSSAGLTAAVAAAAGVTKAKQVHHMRIDDGAGGGGGGTYAFVLNSVGVAVPLVVAAGGGGLGIGRYLGEHEQHGRPMTGVPDDVYSGQVDGDVNVTGGAGGGWLGAPYPALLAAHGGAALLEGGRGGEPCYQPRGIHGQGGFGGGGGGCMSGGGGGGYAGGDTDEKLTNGAGGTSYISRSRSVVALSSVSEGDNSGAGSVVIIPALATPACGCDYRCVALDEYSSVVACICPENWRLKKDNLTACEQIGKERPISQNYLIVFFAIVCVTLVIALSGLIFMLYNRYQRKKQAAIRQKMLMEQDLQLARLRNHPDEHNLNAFNPNYGCEGLLNGRVDVRSLPQVTREKLVLMVVLGRGAFGEVYEGVYRHRDGDTPMPVAVKMLPSMSTKCSEEEFIMEASIMAKFSHPNIVHMIGVCFDRHPRYLVIELLAGGDLKKWLRESRDGEGLSMKDLMFCALDVAKGCRYMESRRFIHRDIAARNCLLSSKGPGRVVKIADFGMARDIYRQDYYKKGGRAMLPIKWMPPEAFLDGIFTAKTDVWSYGVLMWEIFSQGILPYASMANAPVMKYVTNNFRLPQPEGCPDSIYGLMQATWSLLPEDRPTFATIIEQIVACTMDGEIMNAPLPEFMRVLKMMGDNGTVLNVPYNPDECERPEVENAEDDPQDYLVPLDAQRRRAAVAHAAAVAAARIGATGPPPPVSAGVIGSVAANGPVGGAPGGVVVQKSVSSVPMASTTTTLAQPSTPNGIADVPFICSDPHCTNTNHILPPSGSASGSAPPSGGIIVGAHGTGDQRSLETSFSVPKSASNPGDLLPPPPPPSGTAAAAAAALEEAERKLINLDTPQPTPTTIRPPMAFGDRDSSCNSIATITLDPASLEQQHHMAMAGVSPYMNVQLAPAPHAHHQPKVHHQAVQQQQQQQPSQQLLLDQQQALRALKPTAATGQNGYGPHINGDVTAVPQVAAETKMVTNGPEECRGAADGSVTGVKGGGQQPFTIHGYSKRYKPNENHSEISC